MPIYNDLLKDIADAAKSVDERLTCEEVFFLVEGYADVEGVGKYEEIRKDYVQCTLIYSNLQERISALKIEMNDVEEEMQSAHHVLIPQELFTRHYEVVRDLTGASGMEAALILRRASSGVLFLEEINKLEKV